MNDAPIIAFAPCSLALDDLSFADFALAQGGLRRGLSNAENNNIKLVIGIEHWLDGVVVLELGTDGWLTDDQRRMQGEIFPVGSRGKPSAVVIG